MAQTIAIVRGTTSLVHNASPTTIYTQSGGFATRIIFGYFAFFTVSDYSSSWLTVNHISSGAGSGIIGQGRTANYRSSILMPNNGATAPWQYTGQTSSLSNNTGVIRSSVTGYIGGQQPSTLGINAPDSANFTYLPANYWIGPSDSISVSWNDNAGQTATCGYSFVTITES